MVSSTLSVVCESQTTLSGSGTTTASASSGELTTMVWAGASPAVPSTSSWPSCPMSRMVWLAPAKRTASLWTLVTSGHVASIVTRLREAAASRTAGDTPCAEKTTRAPSGTSSVSPTKIAPRALSVSTTYLLWTISLRT